MLSYSIERRHALKTIILHTIAGTLDSRDLSKIASFNKRDWQELFCLASDVKVAPCIARMLLPLIPPQYRKIAQFVLYKNKSRARSQIAALNQIKQESDREGLRFILFKGLSLSTSGYEHLEDRQTGDIDILVDHNDLSRCDYVLKMAGFRQLADSSSSFSDDIGMERAKQTSNEKFHVYPIKRKTHGIQLAPYFSNLLSVRVEAHDGFHGIPKDKMQRLLWMTREMKIGPVEVRVLNELGTFLILIANACENSESVYASFDGELNLRDYIDLDMFFQNAGKNLTARSLLEAVEEFDLSEALPIVLSNYHDVFPDKATPFDALLNPSTFETERVSFVERVFNRNAERERVFANLRSGIIPLRISGTPGDVHEGMWTRFDNEPQLPIDFRVTAHASRIDIEWRLLKRFGFELPLLGFQIAFVPKKARGYLELVVGIAAAHSKAEAFCHESQRLAQRFIVGPSVGSIEASYEETEDFIHLSTSASYALFQLEAKEFEAGIGVIPMMFVKNTGEDYKSLNSWEEDFTTIKSLVLSDK